MLPTLSALVPSSDWNALRQSGLMLIDKGRFGKWALPPDWLQINRVDGQMAPAPDWAPLCSFDAIRIPLYLIWAGLPSPAIAAFATFYEPRADTAAPAWVNLENQAEAPYPAPAGILAVARLARAVALASDHVSLPSVSDATDYYSAALVLLAKIAWQQRRAT
jgi:endoglucanase